MSTIEVKVPNIGDFKGVEVIEVLVNEGQDVKKNDALITIESDKSSIEIPSTHNGKIKNLKLKVGDKVSEGDKILDLETETENVNEEEKNESQDNTLLKVEKKIPDQKISVPINYENKNGDIALASPKARKFARELGVDINQVSGSERNSRVTEQDIKYFVASRSFKNEKTQIFEEKKAKKLFKSILIQILGK